MKAFIYNGRTYIRAIPGKQLFRSTTVHEVINRGDIFAVEVGTAWLTIVPGTAEVEHIELEVKRASAKPVDTDVHERNAGGFFGPKSAIDKLTAMNKLTAIATNLKISHQLALNGIARFGSGDLVRPVWFKEDTPKSKYLIVDKVNQTGPKEFTYCVSTQMGKLPRTFNEVSLLGWREA